MQKKHHTIKYFWNLDPWPFIPKYYINTCYVSGWVCKGGSHCFISLSSKVQEMVSMSSFFFNSFRQLSHFSSQISLLIAHRSFQWLKSSIFCNQFIFGLGIIFLIRFAVFIIFSHFVQSSSSMDNLIAQQLCYCPNCPNELFTSRNITCFPILKTRNLFLFHCCFDLNKSSQGQHFCLDDGRKRKGR